MKRISLLVLFFYCCTFAYAPRARAVAPLALLAPAAIGAAAFAVAGTYFAFKPDHSGSSYGTDGRNLTVPLTAYKPFVVAGAEKLLGKSVTAVLDAKKAFDDNVLQGYSALKSLLDDYFQDPSTPVTPLAPGSAVFGPSQTCGATSTSTLSHCLGGVHETTDLSSICGSCAASAVGNTCISGNNWIRVDYVTQAGVIGYTHCKTVPIDQPENYPYPPPVIPEVLPPGDVPGLTDLFKDAAPIRPDVAQDLDNLLKDHPEYWPIANTPAIAVPDPNNDIADYPPAQPISSGEVSQWAQGQSAGAQQSYIDTLQDLVDANPTDTGLASELAKAQAQQAQQEAEAIEEAADTYNPISANPFDDAYNPGAFDIPARFTTFLNNVKSTGLFSFSSSFFNSLPGGGSPIYTVEAGTYGTHTIDLSETMSTGLAVLKTILLLLFAFLSIRVVILKR